VSRNRVDPRLRCDQTPTRFEWRPRRGCEQRTETAACLATGSVPSGRHAPTSGRFRLPSLACPNGVSYTAFRDAFAIATVSPRTQRLRPLGFSTRDRDYADTDVGEVLRPSLDRADLAFTTGLRPASNDLHRGTFKSPPGAPPGTPSRSTRCHRGSVTGATRFRTRDRNCMAMVAVEELQHFTTAAPLGTPSCSLRGQHGLIHEQCSGHLRRCIRRHSFGIDVGR
jgi:hypothetical protein